MGYTHYWYRKRIIPVDKFNSTVTDFKKLLPLFKILDVKLAGGLGEGEPEFTSKLVRFNGLTKCGHPERDLGIAWPATSEDGIATKPGVAPNSEGAIIGSWFAGVKLNQRTCGGDCSHETLYFPRCFKEKFEQKDKSGKLFAFCKTAYKPYDLAVTAFLIIAKHYIGKDISVHSDGEWKDWIDGAMICNNALGYGMDEKILEKGN